MPNLNVRYARPDYALQTLVEEIRARYGGAPQRVDYVAGSGATTWNFTGHNADSNGIVHGADLFVGTPGNLTEAQAKEICRLLQAEGKRGPIPGHPDRLYYIIFQDKIMGDWSDWTTWDGKGYGHFDHIHVSVCDLYWGDPAPIPAGDYDSTAPWGIYGGTGINPAGAPTPAPAEELIDMEEADLRKLVREEAGKGVWIYSGKLPEEKNNQSMWRRVVNANVGVIRAEAQVAALTEAIKQLATAKGLDAAKLDQVIQASVQKALDAGIVNVDINVKGQPS